MHVMDEKTVPSLAKIHIASSHLRSNSLPITPILTNRSLNQLTGKKIYLKCENFQHTGSFECRGVLNLILNAMKIDPNIKGFLSYSSGNHAIAVAYASASVKRPCLIIIPTNTSKFIIDSIELYGAMILQSDSTTLSPEELSEKYDYYLVPSSDHPDIIAGYGTIAVELLEQIADLDAILVPVDNGDLISGIALYVKQINPNIRIYACIPEGQIFDEYLTKENVFCSQTCEHLRAKCQFNDQYSQQNGKCLCSLIENECCSISNEIRNCAMKFAFENLKLVVDLPSGLSLATIISQYERFDSNIRKLAVLITGGNLDLNQCLPWLENK